MPKIITNPQIIGQQGEAFVSTRANAMGLMFSRYGPLEAGMDGLLEIRDAVTGAASGRLVAVRVKTRNTGSYTGETESAFEYLMDGTDVAYWTGCNLPVIVVLVHLEREQAYWKSPSPPAHPRTSGLYAVGLIGVAAQAAFFVGLVVPEVALEPHHPAVALEGEEVGGDAVESCFEDATERRRSPRRGRG